MNFRKTFEDEGFVYELTVFESTDIPERLTNLPVPAGLWCQWEIRDKNRSEKCELPVTNDDCKVIVYPSLRDAVNGAKSFLSI